ncbi:crossover junction endodeoxyribonuclease RuvC [Micromonospora aurantiaca]|nr:crossover junction endodeoxyribonuclease RuvC [Micromonospora aurantiaca]
MTTTTVIGIDAALAATGVAVWRRSQTGPGRFYLDTIRTSPDTTPRPARWGQITAPIWPCITTNTLAVVEAVFQGAKGDTALRLAELHGVILDGLYRRGVPYVVVHDKQLKKYATNSGAADKDLMLATARSQLGHAAFPADHDQADALWLLAMGLHQYGQQLLSGPVPRWRTKVVADIGWPPDFHLHPETNTAREGPA